MFERPTIAVLLALLGLTASSARAQAGGGETPEDVASVPVLDLRAGGDEHKRYFLIGGPGEEAAERPSREKKRAYKLLVVLPGGDGSPDFRPFVSRIWMHALSEEWLVAQLVAPKWSEDQFDHVVWPTEKQPWPEMAFGTEAFIDAVIDDVEDRHALDADAIFTLSWSSGGPAAHAAALAKRTRIKGSFVAMSVFKPEQLPALKAAKGRSWYLLHSPQDFIPIAMAERAKRELGEAGARVELATYEGGHGWRGDVYGMLRKGIGWLEEQGGKR